jgi:drug/metabolite transporter (DMT)-like permease
MKKAYLQLHLSVLLWGFTAILGKLIEVNALALVWWRMLLTTIFLVGVLAFFGDLKKLKTLPKAVVLKVMGIGCIVALHWLAFYGAIKLANSSVAVVCIATMSLFTAVIEPFILRTKMKWFEVGIGIVIIPAMALIINDLEGRFVLGALVGIVAALLSGVFSILNKIMLKHIEPLQMTFLEISGGGLLLTLVMPFVMWQNPEANLLPQGMSWYYLVLLSGFCTVLPYIMSLQALQKLSAFTTVLAVNLEPVYGVILAWLLLHEDKELSMKFYLGVAIIISSVFVHSFVMSRKMV